MKLRLTTLLISLALFLSACNFTLAADVTPPPGYVAPTPAATMGPLFPPSSPDAQNGARIFAEKCLPCHGAAGLGDGEQGKQLPVTVAAIGLPELAQKALPAAWYMQVTKGNVKRFMPPFASLNDQERWDVVAYALTLHMAPAQLEKGKTLFESKCADCAKKFSNPEKMYSLSELDLIKIIKNGEGDIPAFGKDFSDEEAAAVAMYIRTLNFAAPAPEATATPVVESTPTAEAGTPAAEVTPGAGTEIASTPNAGSGNVSGTVENKTGKKLSSDTKVTLRGFEHGADATAGPVEVTTVEGVLTADGKYSFENVEIPENRIYLAEIIIDGVTYQSEFTVVKAGMTELSLPPIVMYGTTEDFSGLKVTSLQIFFDFANAGDPQMFTLYSIMNDSDKTVAINIGKDEDVPFVAFAKDTKKLGYQTSQDSAPFVPTEKGFAMPPSKTSYGLVAFSSLPKTQDIVISQPVILPIQKVDIFLPEGMVAEGKALTDEGIQPIEGTNFHVYSLSNVEKNTSIDFTIKGAAQDTAVNPDVLQNKNLLIGIGAFGAVLILLGVWLFMRDRRNSEDEESDESSEEFVDSESAMDAIIALDDLHRAGKISDEVYQKRREELKNALKRKP